MTDDPSRRIGDYEVLGVLGEGGMGKVFKVRNVISDRIEAMKILLPDLAGGQELADRFLREIKLLASLDHPNIAQLRTALTLQNRLVMVMEYVEGTTVAARLEQAPIPPAEAIGYITQVLNALSYAHNRNVIHRDIKPANMMVTPNGTVKLMDFGIARASGDASMTVTGTTVGSLFYMSPEQVKGAGVDARSDLYSLGVSLYEMVTGQRPFKADSDYSLMTAQLQERPKPPSELLPGLPGQLNGIILHSMAKEPTERFQTADEFRQSLDALVQSMPALAAFKSVAPIAAPSIASPSPATPSPAAPITSAFPPPAFPASVAAPPAPTAATSVVSGASAPDPSSTAPQFTPVSMPQPAPSVMQMSPQPSKGRGLYMALGAVIVLVVLVLAGISLPRMLKTRAAEQQKQSSDQSAQPNQPQSQESQSATQSSSDANGSGQSAQGSGAQPGGGSGSSSGSADSTKSADGSTGGTPSGDSGSGAASSGSSSGTSSTADNSGDSSKGKSKGGSKKGKSKGSDSSGSSGQGTTAGNDQGNGSNAADQGEPVEEVEKDVDETSSRASAANASIDTMRRSLANQGLNLRGDIASAQELMKTNLDRAQQALQAHDTKNARRYLNQAQANMDKIEKFLGH